MAAPDKKTVIRDLIELGKSKGQLTTKEILDAIGELDFDPEHIEKFYDTLESHGIEIIDDFSDIQIDDIDLSKVSGADTDDFDAGMGMEGVAIDDPVKVYLKEIGRVPLYFDFLLEAKSKVEAKVAELGIPWEVDDYQALPDWKPGCGYEVTDPGFDILPVYYTDAINTDSWLMENPWINEINEENPYGYTIEINAATARAKGFASGDKVRLVTVDGVSVEGVLATSEGVHSECVAVIGGHWGSKSAYMPIAKDKGVPVVHLVPGQTPDRMDHVCSAFDQCIRVKLEKIA